MQHLRLALLVLAVLGSANAATFNLGTLTANYGNPSGSFTVGDKTFSDFTFSGPTTSGCGVGCFITPTDASGVNVLTVDATPYGIRFNGGFWLDNLAGSTLASANFTLQFKVTSNLGATINGLVHAISGATFTGAGSNIISVETAYNAPFPGGSEVGKSTLVLSLNDVIDPPGEANQGDLLNFTTPLQSIYITKDFTMRAAAFGQAKFSILEQRFTQVPEPGFYGLLSLGVGGLIMLRRRKTA